MRPWRAALHFALQQRRKSDADERREKHAVARANAVASSTSRSVSTVAAGSVLTGVAQTSESTESLRSPINQKSENFRVVETRRDDTSFSLETLRVTGPCEAVAFRCIF